RVTCSSRFPSSCMAFSGICTWSIDGAREGTPLPPAHRLASADLRGSVGFRGGRHPLFLIHCCRCKLTGLTLQLSRKGSSGQNFPELIMPKSRVAVVRTDPSTVLSDYRRLMHLAGYRQVLDPSTPLLLKLNLSWTKYFPSCSSQPWQLEGVLTTLREDGYPNALLTP